MKVFARPSRYNSTHAENQSGGYGIFDFPAIAPVLLWLQLSMLYHAHQSFVHGGAYATKAWLLWSCLTHLFTLYWFFQV